MNHSTYMLNQILWLMIVVMTLGLVALTWKRPVSKQVQSVQNMPAPEAKPRPKAESTLVVMKVRKIYPPQVPA